MSASTRPRGSGARAVSDVVRDRAVAQGGELGLEQRACHDLLPSHALDGMRVRGPIVLEERDLIQPPARSDPSGGHSGW